MNELFVDSNVILQEQLVSDVSVVNAARVSMDRMAEEFTQAENDKLIRYLATHGHWSPFTHNFIKFYIHIPIFVARQLVKHQVGFAWNEVSRRYVKDNVQFYHVPYFRQGAKHIKQGSLDAPVDSTLVVLDMYRKSCLEALSTYNEMLQRGVCVEQARAVLPCSTMTKVIWSGNLYGFARMCKQRLDPHAQRETQDVAKKVAASCATLAPVSWAELMNEHELPPEENLRVA